MHSNKPTTARPSYRNLIDQATNKLYDNSESPRIDSEVLLQHVIERPLAWLVAHSGDTASEQHIERFEALIEQRYKGTPIAYLIGYKEFWSVKLEVNKNVLIPRADTETLVEAALDLVSKQSPLEILDLGTGSGAIALAFAKELPLSKVTATDVHAEALDVAIRNAKLNQLENVMFLQSDWYQSLGNRQFDLIVSNPPYVEKGDPHLDRGDLRFEPDSALIGAGDGLDDIRHIAHLAPLFLKENGYLVVEHGYNQAEQTRQILHASNFKEITLHKDLNALPRCTSARCDLITLK